MKDIADIVLQRPIFSPSRRPFVAAPVAPAVEPVPEQVQPEQAAPLPVAVENPEPPPQFSLKGILISPDKSSAFLVTAGIPAGQWLGIGDDFAGWTIKSIENNAVTLVRGEQSTVVELYVDNSQNGLGLARPTR
jgi:general secretion pathway protein N